MTEDHVSKILIVDDMENNRMILGDIVEDAGYTCMLASNGLEALKIIEQQLPDLVITDLHMPEMDGIELCETLKGDPMTREIPVIFTSADGITAVKEGFNKGGIDYIASPFYPDAVRARVELHLQLHDTRMELEEANRRLQASVKEQLKQIEREKKNMLYALARVARENAAFIPEHSDRIAYNCKTMAEALQLTNEYAGEISDTFVDTISWAAPMCDLGNVAIPGGILQKVDPLEDDERDTVREHSALGGMIIKDIMEFEENNDFLKMSYDIAMGHHEYYNGEGYPYGKKGNEIPLSAQIVSVVSAYCALTEERSYRPAFEPADAVEMINKKSGTKFTPKLCEVLTMIYRRFH